MPYPERANHLLHEPSPYLQQHAYNPVDWYPWGELAFKKAREENKPILLSIGYAACHWCHVMAHESFEDKQTAALMDKWFINIKVDKEERPDLDKIYQTAHYILSGQGGGWPLTLFLTPDLVPFFSGTYFPKKESYQLPSFKQILKIIADHYQNNPQQINQQNQELLRLIRQEASQDSSVTLDNKPLERGLLALQQNYDEKYGGFGDAPKFPQASKLEFLLHQSSPIALSTLTHIARGGIYDQLAGGFFRYTVDKKWRIPHFEKMLYDNGQLLALYSLAGKYDGETFFNDIIRETALWVIEALQAPEGGFYSSFDADSEGMEGSFYVWDKAEVKALLSEDEFALVNLYYGLDNRPNFERKWHFYVANPVEDAQSKALLLTAKKKLLQERVKRVPPFRDEKMITSWNGLMIKGLLLAGSFLNEPSFIDSATRALYFIQQYLWQKGTLFACYKGGKAYLGGYLDDYVFLLDALLTSLQVSWNSEHLEFARALADAILDSFASENAGGFYFTPKNHEALLYRPKVMMDEATPSGNGILVRTFLLLGYLLGDSRYLSSAENTLQAAWPMLQRYPAEHCSLLLGLKELLHPSPLIIIRGEQEESRKWQQEVQSLTNYSFVIPNDATNLPDALTVKKVQGKVCAYVCRGLHCDTVITDRSALQSVKGN